tara:strand:+ start:1315 stop:1707 length:393 start_codon:yes stop_codon:yes gene_type:complete
MAEANLFALSGKNQLHTGIGWFSYSGLVSCTTNAKPVINVVNTGQRDSMITVTFSGSVELSDLNAGSNSCLAILLGGETIVQNKIQTLDAGNPYMFEVSLFVPRNSSLLINVTDADTTGKTTTILRAYYV